MKFERKIEALIAREELFDLTSKLLVCVSGGADSVALLRVLTSLGYDCVAAHCNFRLRGEESLRDERFVRDFCEALQVPLQVTSFDTRAYAAAHHLSIEMAARELRYRYFDEVSERVGASFVVVAHHRDDSVETVLLNLMRGTGIQGLQGIRPKNGKVVRPLLEVSRQEILAYLDVLHQSYVTDSTNLEDDFVRNKIRLRLLPLMEEINPSVKESIAETANRLAELNGLYQQTVQEGRERVTAPLPAGEGFSVDIHRLLGEPAPKSLLFELIRPLGFHGAQAEQAFRLLTAPSGRQLENESWRVLKDRTSLLVYPKPSEESNTFEALLGEDGSLTLPDGALLQWEWRNRQPGETVPKEKQVAYLDADKLDAPLQVRLWREGDRWMPFGMKGMKLVSDYLTDRKFSQWKKQHQWVLCTGERIAWLVNERTDQRCCVDERTKRLLVIRVNAG